MDSFLFGDELRDEEPSLPDSVLKTLLLEVYIRLCAKVVVAHLLSRVCLEPQPGPAGGGERESLAAADDSKPLVQFVIPEAGTWCKVQ